MKKLFAILIVTLTAGTFFTYGQQQGIAGPDFEVNLLGGSKFKLSEQTGKVVLVFLFGNTCSNCLAIGPSVETNLYREFAGNQNFTAVGLDTWDSSSNESSVTGFQTRTGITFPLALKAGSVASSYGTTYDRLMVIDQDGVLVHKGEILVKNDIDNAAAAIRNSLTVAGIGTDPERDQVNLYPNPVSEVLHVNAAEEISNIELFDVSGKRVMEVVFSNLNGPSEIGLSVENLHPGIYFYSIRTTGTQRNGKLVIQR